MTCMANGVLLPAELMAILKRSFTMDHNTMSTHLKTASRSLHLLPKEAAKLKENQPFLNQ